MRLRWLAAAGLGLGLMLLASVMLQSRSVLHSFQTSDQLVASLRHFAADADLLVLCHRVQTQRPPTDTASVLDDGRPDAVVQGMAAGLGPDEVSRLLAAMRDTASPSLAALCTSVTRDLASLQTGYPALDTARTEWQADAYRLLLVTGNLVALVLAIGTAVVLLYANKQALTMRRIDRARRAVLQAERRQAGFLAAAGHDLRQPLQALRLFLSIMLQRRMDPETRAIGNKVEAAAASMQRMIGSLVDVAKLDAGLIAADWRDVPLGTLLGSFAEEFRQMASEAGISFSVQETGAVIHTDPDLLERILRNLIGNAVRYTSKGGVSVQVRTMQHRAIIAVHDTGVGIHPDHMQTVFDDFFRVNQSGSDGLGLGLGLGIVKRLSDLLDAPVTVESTPGVGSVFSVTVPLGADYKQDDYDAKLLQASSQKRRTTALVVDDNLLVRDALATQLECRELDVCCAASHSQALQMLADQGSDAFDIIVTDYDLGDGNGLDLLAQFEREASKRPCALIITGTSDQRVWERLHRCSYRWLAKPIDLARLEAEIGFLKDCARNRAQSRKVIHAP